MVYFEEFNRVSGSEAQKRAQIDFDDLQNEAAGRDVGRVQRFHAGGQLDQKIIQKRREDRDTTTFLALMENAKFAALYAEVDEKLREAAKAIDDAKAKLGLFCGELEELENGIMGRTARLPDGTLVFQGDDGQAYTRDGKLSDHPDAQNIIWRDDPANLTEIQIIDQRRQKVEAFENKLNGYDAEIGDMIERHKDTDSPLSSEDLEDMLQRTEDIRENLTKEFKELQPRNSDSELANSATNDGHLALQIKGLDGV